MKTEFSLEEIVRFSRKFCGIAFLVLFLTLAGCTSFWSLPPESKFVSRHGIVLRGPFSKESAEAVDKAFDAVPAAVRESVRSISIIDDLSQYQRATSAGECDHFGNIIVKSFFVIEPSLIWHETGHAYHFRLDYQRKDFTSDWLAAAGKVYRPNAEPTIYPGLGVLEQYGWQNYEEDVGVYMAEFYRVVNGHHSWFNLIKETNEPRYRQKVDLLLKYGFISEADYKKFMSKIQLP